MPTRESILVSRRIRVGRYNGYTGLRHGELAALAWEDIDLDAGVIHISRNLTILGHFGPPKTQAGIRTVTLLKPA